MGHRAVHPMPSEARRRAYIGAGGPRWQGALVDLPPWTARHSACPVTRPTPYRFIGGSSSRLGGVHIDRSCAAAAFWTRHSLLRARLSAPATGRPPTDRAMTDPRQSLHVRDADGGERDGGCSHSCSKTWCDALGRLRRGETVRLCMPRRDGTGETRCERLDRARVAHNPEVGGSNPPPATENCLMA